MKKILCLLSLASLVSCTADDTLIQSLHQINHFHFASEQIASSGHITSEQYQNIKDYGFKHVINLIPGNQVKERTLVQSLGLSYAQIAVDWNNPTAANFAEFSQLMQSFGHDRIFVHCEMNMRASAFVFLYRVIHQDVPEQDARKEMLKIWQPEGTWDQFINTTIETHKSLK